MNRCIILFAACLLLTGTMSAVAVQITKDMFDEEFMKYVTTPCMTALNEKSGTPELFSEHSLLMAPDQWALLQYRYGRNRMAAFNRNRAQRKTYLSNVVRGEPLHVRQAWYAVTVQLCLKTLPE